jgi:hypothetical protein
MAEVLGVYADRSAPGYPLIRLQAFGAKAGIRCYPSREYQLLLQIGLTWLTQFHDF